ncbi:di-N-acetylchitobiase-like isoform X2 [Dendronephthya gigantea]|uniref:di-N-acetylchitobiase-like isoform X2 n=1 Tax=Dendronephthya gigantea TaxID=151771 RepID=UPI00106CA9EA|nr:di-N-acetylchitobiase-like isoform X2 [Dendronephthya gigantea]
MIAEDVDSARSSPCPCSDEKLCQRITKEVDKEVLVWSTSDKVWQHYNWSVVTTVAVFGDWNDELMCFAHSKGVKVVLVGFFNVNDLSNTSKCEEWVDGLITKAIAVHADGVNLDLEGPISKGSKEVNLLNELTADVYKTFKDKLPGSQVTFDVAWSPDCIDGRCYDVATLSKSVDFLAIMSYDEMSQIFGPECTAYANSPFNKTKSGVSKYMDLGIPANKLVLGLPWYGYDYQCIAVTGVDTCHIKKVPYQGANCSDAAGKQVAYSTINDLLLTRTESGRKWDAGSQSPYFDYYDMSNQRHQMWYDDPQSLGIKLAYAVDIGLKGAAVWNSDLLDYSALKRSIAQTKDMWVTLSSIKEKKNKNYKHSIDI